MNLKFFSKIALFSLLFIGCQSEENVVIQDNPENLNNASPLTSLMGRVTQNPTSADNILDNTSCFSVILPVTVIVNGQNIEVTSEIDYQTVQTAINEFTDDDDLINFVYPINIQFQNFSTLTIQNADDFEDVIEDCGEDDDFDEIDCISFNFPISINVYNANNQLAETINIQNNVEFYNFLDNLEDNELIQIQYPVTLIDANGNNITINNNNQLEDAIENLIDDCEDDNDDDDNNPGNDQLVSVLTDGTWFISYFFDNVDETSNFTGYTFSFNTNGTTTAVKNGTSTSGVWTNFIDDSENKLELSYQGTSLDDLEDDWEIIEFSANEIRLKDVSGGNGGTDYLYFTKN